MKLLEILESDVQTFIDVQDLVFKWVYLRSFELRPELINFMIEFLLHILKKYAGSDILEQIEKEILAFSVVQLHISFSIYVSAKYFEELIVLLLLQLGDHNLVAVLMSYMIGSNYVKKFHQGTIAFFLETIMAKSGGQSLLKPEYLQILEQMSYSNQKNVQLQCLMLAKELYKLDPQLVAENVQSKDTELLSAIQHLIKKEQGDEVITDEPQSPEKLESHQYSQSGTDNSHQTGYSATKGNINEIETFCNDLVESDDNFALQYLQYMRSWVDDDEYQEGLVTKADSITSQIIKYIQMISCRGLELSKEEVYTLIFDIFDVTIDKKNFVDNLDEETIFDFIDTVFLILI